MQNRYTLATYRQIDFAVSNDFAVGREIFLPLRSKLKEK